MGNDTSVLAEYDIKELNYSEIGQWTLHEAIKKNEDGDVVTVFMGKLKSYGQLNREFQRSLESLKTIRHPSVLRYLNSCISGETAYLFVEYVLPLKNIIQEQSALELCCGLQNILIALDFIHSKVGVVHNNVCKDAVFVTKSGHWKLGFFDCSCSLNEVTPEFLDQIRSLRYDKSVPPEDEQKVKFERENVVSRDIFGFGQLVKETIGNLVDSSISSSAVFCELACKEMQNSNSQLRGTAISLSKHTFFDQPLLRAQEFLTEIAIKSETDKELFFQNLPPVLYSAPEEVISKLAELLLSRMVVLNRAAQQHLLPHLLIPRTDATPGLFDVSNYRHFILPIVTRIFPVRDAQIRLLLLQYFPYYTPLMEKEVLVQRMLPELLLGIKDIDDAVVSATLRALADLVVHLGSSTVIGGTRLKLFANGTPKSPTGKRQPILTSYIPLSCKRIEGRRNSLEVALSPTMNMNDSRVNSLPERHDPDGGEDAATCLTNNPERASPSAVDDFEGEWSDWESEEVSQPEAIQPIQLEAIQPIQPEAAQPEVVQPEVLQHELTALSLSTPSKKALASKKASGVIENDFDLASLDIQVKAKENVEEEIDYFADMQPTITKSIYVEPPTPVEPQLSETIRLNFSIQQEEEASDGWNWEED